MEKKKFLYAEEPFRWRKTANGDWDEYEYPAGTKVEVIGSSVRGYDVKIVKTGVVMCETGLMKWSTTPIKKTPTKSQKGLNKEDKEMLIKWFESIHDNLDKKFSTRFTEKLEGQRGRELDAVNDEIARCKRCIEYIKEFM